MNTFDYKKFIYVTAVLLILFLGLLIGALDHFDISQHTIMRLPTAITATIMSWAAIIKWLWNKWPFSALLNITDLQGTWVGHIQSNWFRGIVDCKREIPIVFVIKQDLMAITVISFTEDRHGVSYVAQITKSDAANAGKLIYLYSLREEFRAGEGTQQGAAELRIVGKSDNELRGEYWTNTQTRGRIILRHRSSKEVESFRDAKSKWKPSSWLTFESKKGELEY